ncbi:hypothetical protein M8J75_010056 [Diaphorina citri]|nr:hypothetical protein M8J75_010056 [Diaphorina citri]
MQNSGLNKSHKKLNVEQNPDQVLSELLRKYSNCIQQVSKLRVELAQLEMDAELMHSTGALFDIELNKITTLSQPMLSNEQTTQSRPKLSNELMDTSAPTENP